MMIEFINTFPTQVTMLGLSAHGNIAVTTDSNTLLSERGSRKGTSGGRGSSQGENECVCVTYIDSRGVDLI